MSRKIRLRRIAAALVVLAVLGGGVAAPVAHAGTKTTSSGKKWK
ncbi:MAG: hypothetical protein ABR613_03250 [Actinomycetota bacterium]